MSGTWKNQVKSGFRLGGGLAVFLIAIVPLVDGLRRVVWTAPSHQLIWYEPIGWIELLASAALLSSTAQLWVHYVAGCMLFACIKCAVNFISEGPISRLDSAKPLFLFLITIVLMVGIIIRGTTKYDRYALTVYVFSLAWGADKGLFMPEPSLAIGLGALFTSWGFYHWQHRRSGKGLPPEVAS